LVNEALPFVEKSLHIEPIKRALMGDSLAGTLAFMVATEFPNTFNKVIMQSPYINEHLVNRAKQAKNFTNLEVFHSIGLEETEVKTTSGEVSDFLTPNREVARLLEDRINHYIFDEFQGNHTWKYWQRDLKAILIKMFR